MKKLEVRHLEDEQIDSVTKVIGVALVIVFVSGIIIANHFGLTVN